MTKPLYTCLNCQSEFRRPSVEDRGVLPEEHVYVAVCPECGSVNVEPVTPHSGRSGAAYSGLTL